MSVGVDLEFETEGCCRIVGSQCIPKILANLALLATEDWHGFLCFKYELAKLYLIENMLAWFPGMLQTHKEGSGTDLTYPDSMGPPRHMKFPNVRRTV